MAPTGAEAAASDVRLVLEIAVVTGCVAVAGIAVWLATEMVHGVSTVYRMALSDDSVMDDLD